MTVMIQSVRTPPNKTDAGNGSDGICRVIDASRSPLPDRKRWALLPVSRELSLCNTSYASGRYSDAGGSYSTFRACLAGSVLLSRADGRCTRPSLRR